MKARILQIAWRNINRNKRRTGLALLAIAIGQFALLASDGLMRGYTDNIRLAITGPMIGHVQVHAHQWRQEHAIDLFMDQISKRIAVIDADPAVDSASARVYAPVLVAPEQDAFIALVVGVQPDIESQSYGLLSGFNESLKPGHVLIGYRLARKIQTQPGQEIAVIGQAADGSLANDLYVVQGIIKCPADMINQSGVVMSLADAQQLFVMPDKAHEIVIRDKISGQAEAVARRLSGLPLFKDTEVLPWQKLVPELVLILKTSDYVGYFVLIIIFLAAIAGIANTIMMSTFERFHEFGMLLALGTRPFRIVRMIILEAVLIGILGVIIGTVLGYAFVLGTADSGIDMASWGGKGHAEDIGYMGLNLPLLIYPRIESFDVCLGLAAVIVTSLVASIWPAWIAGRLEPMEAMRA